MQKQSHLAILPLTILSLLPMACSWATNLLLTTISPSTLHADWTIKTIDYPMDFSASNGRVYCADALGGLTCGVFKINAFIHQDYNSLYNQLYTINGKDWPIYKNVKAAGGSKNFPLLESDHTDSLQKARYPST